MSWDEAFARRYDEWAAPMTEDVGFYVSLAGEADGPLVELAVGNGRVAIPVAQATGRPVIGIDTSPAMLEQARARAAAAGVELELREGDMRELTLEEQAAASLAEASVSRWPAPREDHGGAWATACVQMPRARTEATCTALPRTPRAAPRCADQHR